MWLKVNWKEIRFVSSIYIIINTIKPYTVILKKKITYGFSTFNAPELNKRPYTNIKPYLTCIDNFQLIYYRQVIYLFAWPCRNFSQTCYKLNRNSRTNICILVKICSEWVRENNFRLACSSTDNFWSPIPNSDWLLFCCGILILLHKKKW